MPRHLLLLGTPAWSEDGSTVQLRRSEAALLAYLGDHAPRSVRREALASLFWPDTSHTRALRSLSQLHYQIRRKIPSLPWIADARVLGLSHLSTDIDLLADRVASGDHHAAFELIRGPFLVERYAGSDELELWRTRKHGQVLSLIETAVEHVLGEGPGADYHDIVAKAIDHLTATQSVSKQLVVARIVLHLRRGEVEPAKRLHETACEDFEEVPPLDELSRRISVASPESQLGPNLPFVGRNQEVAAINKALDQARSGSGSLIVLAGEPGIGKTRLATHVVKRAALAGFMVHKAQAHSATQRVPCSTLTTLVADLCTGLDASIGNDIISGLRSPSGGGTGYAQFEAIRSLVDVLEQKSREQPSILYIDDTQWVDETTAQFLQYLSVRLSSISAVVVLTLRTSEPDPTPDWLLRGLPAAVRLRIGQLDIASSRQLIDAFEAAAGLRLRADQKESILWATAGRPLLIAEVLRVATPHSTGSYKNDVTLSASTEDLLRRRFIGLSSDALWVQGIVAAVGQPVHVSELTQLCGMPLNVVAGHTDVLLQRAILEDLGKGLLDFPHDLLRQIAYKGLSGPTRALLHRKIAEHAMQAGGTTESIAQHLALALDYANASVYALQAGRQALREYRYADAEFFHTLALNSPGSEERQEAALALARLYFQSGRPDQIKLLAPHIDPSQRGRQGHILLMLARLAENLKEGSSSIDDLMQSARSVSDAAILSNATEFVSIFGSLIDIALDANDRSLGDSIVSDFKRMALAADDPDLQWEIDHVGLLWDLMHDGYDRPMKWIEGAELAARQESGSALPRFAAGTILMMAGRLTDAAAALNEALEIAFRAYDLGRQFAIRANLGIVLTEMGNYGDAQQHLEINLAAPKSAHRLRSIGNLAILALHQGNYPSAISYANSLIAANVQHQSARYSETAHAVMGLAALHCGSKEDADAAFTNIWCVEQESIRTSGELSYTACFAGRYLFEKGSSDKAMQTLNAAETALNGRDWVGLLRVRSVKAGLLAQLNDEVAYPYAKAVYLAATEAGAFAVAARARQTMIDTRA